MKEKRLHEIISMINQKLERERDDLRVENQHLEMRLTTTGQMVAEERHENAVLRATLDQLRDVNHSIGRLLMAL